MSETTFAQRFEIALSGEKPGSFAKRSGIGDSTIRRYLTGTLPAIDKAHELATALNVRLEWLAADDGPMRSSPTQNQSMRAFPGETQVLLPRYDVRASAGAGSLIVSEDVSEHFAVGRDWLRRNLPPWAPLNARVGVLENGGDSMWPTIQDGDLLIIVQDVEWRIVERGGIFVFSLDDHRLLLKRLQVLNNGDLKIISDNKAYEPDVIPFDDIEHRVRVHGMVFFAGGKPRGYA